MLFPIVSRKLLLDFKSHVQQGRGGACDYDISYEPLYSPFYGEAYLFGNPSDEGGYWIGIKREDGLRIEFAHLSERSVKNGDRVTPGQQIGITGRSGTLTGGIDHLHLQILDKDGTRIDPEQFFIPTNIPIIAINGGLPFLNTLQAKILEYSQGMLTISWDMPIFGIPTYPTQDQAYEILDKFLEQYPTEYLPNRYFFLFSGGSNAFLQTYYYPKHDCTISVIPRFGYNAESVAFEFSHAITQYYNEHRGQNSQIQDTDSNFPTSQFTIAKYRSILPYTDILI